LMEHDLFGKPVSTFPDHALKRDGFMLKRHRARNMPEMLIAALTPRPTVIPPSSRRRSTDWRR
jgi:hypothetical protein